MSQARNIRPFRPNRTGAVPGPEVKPDHVVVFVHGMGKALKGGTLQEWAQPLMFSLYDLSLDLVGPSTHPHLIIDAARAVGDTPELYVRVLKSEADGADYLNVLMTEASWGADFEGATPTATFSWALSMAGTVFEKATNILWWNLYAGARDGSLRWVWKRFLQIVLFTVAVVTGFLLMLAGLTALLIVVLLSHIPGIGRWLSSFVSTFADFLGDPQAWGRKPLQAAAMRQRVRDTLLRWDHDNSIDVTVVAHSQGAAIAGQVLFQGEKRGRATNFVSVGSGLKLLGYARWGGQSVDPVADWLENPEVRWINAWGKFDFVPAGPISTESNGTSPVFRKLYDRASVGDGGPGPEEHPIYNRSALIYDHIVYSQNRIEIIDPIARLVLGPSNEPGSLWFRGIDNDRRRRPHRVLVKTLGLTRVLSVATGILTAPFLLAWLEAQSWVRSIARCAATPSEPDPWWSVWRCSASGAWWVLIVAAAIITGALIWTLNALIWNWLHEREERRRKKNGDLHGHRWWNVVTYLACVGALTVALPLIVASPGDAFKIAYPLAAAALCGACFIGTRIQPLPARIPVTRPSTATP